VSAFQSVRLSSALSRTCLFRPYTQRFPRLSSLHDIPANSPLVLPFDRPVLGHSTGVHVVFRPWPIYLVHLLGGCSFFPRFFWPSPRAFFFDHVSLSSGSLPAGGRFPYFSLGRCVAYRFTGCGRRQTPLLKCANGRSWFSCGSSCGQRPVFPRVLLPWVRLPVDRFAWSVNRR